MTPTVVIDNPTLSLFDIDEDIAGRPTSDEAASRTSAAAVDEAMLPPAGAAERVAHNLTVIRLLRDLRERPGAPSRLRARGADALGGLGRRARAL